MKRGEMDEREEHAACRELLGERQAVERGAAGRRSGTGSGAPGLDSERDLPTSA